MSPSGDALAFSKYEGAANDFVMVLDLDDELTVDVSQVAALCDRHTGIGADGFIRIVRGETNGDPATGADFTMDYRNADGSPAEMCGNGIRCVGKLLHDRGLVGDELTVATRAGVRRLWLHAGPDGLVREVTATMGRPGLTRAEIPMTGSPAERFLGRAFEVDAPAGAPVTASAVSIGNPHVVLLLPEDPAGYPVERIGPAVEHDERFPEGTNVEFAFVTTGSGAGSAADGVIRTRVWERGSGETMACGSGAVAVAVAVTEAGLVPWPVTVRFPGGDLVVDRDADGELLLCGPVRHVFDGTVTISPTGGPEGADPPPGPAMASIRDGDEQA